MTAATPTDPGDTPVLPLDGVDRAVEKAAFAAALGARQQEITRFLGNPA